MQYNLDPLTGLPVIGGTDIVSQIPLGTQVVPWGDIGPSTLPQQGPAYPNDIINTFGWVTGEQVDNPGVVRAGTMTPDRRLRVDTGQSGAAVPPTVEIQTWEFSADFGIFNLPIFAAHNVLPVMTTIWGFELNAFLLGSSVINTTNDFGIFFCANGVTDPRFTFVQGVLTSDGSGNSKDPSYFYVHKEYPVGMQLSTLLNAPPGHWDLAQYHHQDHNLIDLAIYFT